MSGEAHHLVTWSIDVFGHDSPEGAARAALATMRRMNLDDPESPSCFVVKDQMTDETARTVDLSRAGGERRPILTNGTRCGEVGPMRRFELVAEAEGFAWVKAMNGNYAGELLTFERSALRELEQGEK